MPETISPYDRRSGEGSRGGFIALLASVALHVAALAFFLFLGEMSGLRPLPPTDVIRVTLGSAAPPAPAAPKDLPVNPDQNKPDVQEAPRSAPTPPARPVPATNAPVTAPPDDVIPIGPKTPDKPPVIERTPEKPPQVTPPKVETPKPKTPPKPKRDTDQEKLDKALKDLEIKRKKEADQEAEDDPDVRLWNTNLASGHGDGESSEGSRSMRGERTDPEKARYYEHIQDLIAYNWVPQDPGAEIVTLYRIVIQPDGRVSSANLAQSSGNAAFDISVERAIKQSSPFPPLPPVFNNQALNVQFRFSLRDLVQRSNTM